MFFTVTQLCGGKRCLRDKDTVSGLSLSDDLSIVFLLPLRRFPPSPLFPPLLCVTRCFPFMCSRRSGDVRSVMLELFPIRSVHKSSIIQHESASWMEHK